MAGGPPPAGNTCTGSCGCIAANADGGNGPCCCGAPAGLAASGWTPSALAFRVILRAIRGERICERSMPPGVYVNGFLSLVIMAFWTQAGGSGRRSDISDFRRTAGTAPSASGGGGGGGGPPAGTPSV